ncbi:arf-GAP with dual PH domain-containing protein 1-like isoform X6 [Syngnathus acus]|uniref:arf-GAP with dual PH domain-containing protein 1-like isoform X6 n=1 Tax=Syngnathus acus TaxID=161584 RepID=UPI0018864C66|nr:arf-GAP with dual PH domain-containing protein 1-like isoform X6 [Syngnathus acus]
MFSERENSRKRLMELLGKPGNSHCADCGATAPEWASYTLGVFVCHSCSGLHRNIAHISKVKSLLLDPWTTAQLELMDSVGNHAAKATYEQTVPAFYFRPTHKDCALLREQWIRAKYERKEFMPGGRQESYSVGYREGFLWKRGKDNGQYLSRKFVLCEQEGVLKYFNKHDGREPKAIMSIATLNATFQPVKIGTAHGLQISYLKDENPRNLFVYHEDGKEMVDWFNTIRAARLSYLRVAFPGAPVADLLPKLTRDYVKQGFMEKTGPKHTEGFKKRWFCMDERRLMYFKDPLDAYARGQVFIGSQENGYDVLPGLPPGVHTSRWQYGITVATPDRTYLFACESEKERTGWIAAFHTFIGCPMLPQEYAVEARFKHQLDY